VTAATLNAALKAIAANMSEDDLLHNVIDLAHVHHWLVNHQHPAKVGTRTMTAIQGDRGLPDLVLAKAGVTLLAELKTEDEQPTDAQERWLLASGGYLWRPSDWLNNTIHCVLSARPGSVPSPRRYGECQTCLARVALTKRGDCRAHNQPNARLGVDRCTGSGRRPIYTRVPAAHIPGIATVHLPDTTPGETPA
jgi:hypothetical protein